MNIEPSVYDMTGAPPTTNIIMIDPQKVEWDDTYQKPPDMEWVKAINRAFNLDFFLPVLLSRRDGHYYCIDGMNRREVAILRGIDLPSIIYPDASRAREASIFKAVNHDRRVVHFHETLRAALVAGQPWAVDLRRICSASGLELELTANAPSAGRIAAVKSLYLAYKRGNLHRTLQTLVEVWGTADPKLFSRAMVTGLSSFLYRYDSLLDQARLDEVLRATHYRDILRRAAALQASGEFQASSYNADTLARAVSQELLLLYNYKRKGAERLPDRPRLRILRDDDAALEAAVGGG